MEQNIISLFPEDWVKKGAPDIKFDINNPKECIELDSKVDAYLKKENEYEKNARTFLSNKGVKDFEMFQEEFGALESELSLFTKDDETKIDLNLIPIPKTNDKYYHKIQATIPDEVYPVFLQWVREMSKVEARKKGFKIPIEYKYNWDGKESSGKALIVAPTFRKLPKGLGVNRFGDVDMDDILRYGLDDDIQKMYDKILGHWEEFSKYLGELKPGEKPEKPDWMSDEQWAEIYAITLKEVYEEQEEFNRSMVQKIPEEVAEMYFEKMRKEKLEEQKAQSSNIITIEGKDVSNEENTVDDDSYSL